MRFRKLFIIILSISLTSVLFNLNIYPVNSTNFTEINSWGYQLQNYNTDKLQSADVDLLVIDYSRDGSDDEKFTEQEIIKIKESGKTVICYISIGEAEDYRWYFDNSWLTNPPSWFDDENPDWEGNYKVKFWDEDWQAIIFDYIDEILDIGFDGLYLDIIDAYEFYESRNSNSRNDMIGFVEEISSYVDAYTNVDKIIIPQNAEELLADQSYLDSVDGIAKEDLFITPGEFSDSGKDEKRDSGEIEDSMQYLDLLLPDNKLVLTVDYFNDPGLVSFVKETARDKNYIPYIGVLELDILVDQDNISANSDSNYPFMVFLSSFTLICVASKKVNLRKLIK